MSALSGRSRHGQRTNVTALHVFLFHHRHELFAKPLNCAFYRNKGAVYHGACAGCLFGCSRVSHAGGYDLKVLESNDYLDAREAPP